MTKSGTRANMWNSREISIWLTLKVRLASHPPMIWYPWMKRLSLVKMHPEECRRDGGMWQVAVLNTNTHTNTKTNTNYNLKSWTLCVTKEHIKHRWASHTDALTLNWRVCVKMWQTKRWRTSLFLIPDSRCDTWKLIVTCERARDLKLLREKWQDWTGLKKQGHLSLDLCQKMCALSDTSAPKFSRNMALFSLLRFYPQAQIVL